MKFEKRTKHNTPYWFSGVYKIVEYHFDGGEPVKPYYHAYVLPEGGTNWGDYVDPSVQRRRHRLSFNECVRLCDIDAQTELPTVRQLKRADEVRLTFEAIT